MPSKLSGESTFPLNRCTLTSPWLVAVCTRSSMRWSMRSAVAPTNLPERSSAVLRCRRNALNPTSETVRKVRLSRIVSRVTRRVRGRRSISSLRKPKSQIPTPNSESRLPREYCVQLGLSCFGVGSWNLAVEISLLALAEDIAVEPGEVPAHLRLAAGILHDAVFLAGVDQKFRRHLDVFLQGPV